MKRMLYMAALALCMELLLPGARAEGAQVPDASALFSDRDLRQDYDAGGAVVITLTGDGAACDSGAVVIDGSRITIAAEGVYVLSGTLADGQVVVQAGEADKVQLVLDGAEITCEYQYGVSNEVLPGKTAKISVRDGKLLLIKICRQ